MPAVQTEYKTQAEKTQAEIPIANPVKITEVNGKQALELQANIGGQDQTILLTLNALDKFGLSNRAVVNELSQIRQSLDRNMQGVVSLLKQILPFLRR